MCESTSPTNRTNIRVCVDGASLEPGWAEAQNNHSGTKMKSY